MGSRGEPIRRQSTVTTLADIARFDAFGPSLSNHHQRIKRRVLRSTKASWRQKLFARILYSTGGDAMIACVAIANFIAIILNADSHAAGKEDYLVVEIANWVCFGMYFLELCMRAYVERWQLLRRAVNWLDILVVVVGLVEAIVSVGSGAADDESAKQVARCFRIARLLRICKVYALVSLSPHLRKLVFGIMSCLPTLFYSVFLVFAFVTTWAIVAVEMIGPIMDKVAETTNTWEECDRCPRSFRSVMGANLTFFQTIVAGDSWGLVAIPVIERFPWTGLIFIGALFSVVFGLLNLIIAVLVDTAAEARSKDMEVKAQRAQEAERKERRALEKIFKEIDKDENGTLSFQELASGAQNIPEFKHKLRALDINADDIGQLFVLCDEDGSGEIDVEEFVHTLQKISAGDSKTASMLVKHYVVHMQRNQDLLAERMDGVEGKLVSLPTSLSREVMQQLRTLNVVDRGLQPSLRSGSTTNVGGLLSSSTTYGAGLLSSSTGSKGNGIDEEGIREALPGSGLSSAEPMRTAISAKVLWETTTEMSAHSEHSGALSDVGSPEACAATPARTAVPQWGLGVPPLSPRSPMATISSAGGSHRSHRLLAVPTSPSGPRTPGPTPRIGATVPNQAWQSKEPHVPDARKHDTELDTLEGLRHTLDQRLVAMRMADTVLTARESLDRSLREALDSLVSDWKPCLSNSRLRSRSSHAPNDPSDGLAVQRMHSAGSTRTSPDALRHGHSSASIRRRQSRSSVEGAMSSLQEALEDRLSSILERELSSLQNLQKDLLQSFLAGANGPLAKRKCHVLLVRNNELAE